MALTITKDSDYGALFPVQAIAESNLKILTGKIAFDSSYPTGGESLDLSDYFPVELKGIIFENKSGYSFEYNYANKKVKALVPVNIIASTGVADANNTIMKSAAAALEVAGTGTAFQVAAAEVLDTTDLSAVTGVRFLAWGY